MITKESSLSGSTAFSTTKGAGTPSETPPTVSGESAATRGTADGKGVHSGCPVYREELGRSTWTLLHTTAAYTSEKPAKAEQEHLRQFLGNLSTFYPCEDCASEFRDLLVYAIYNYIRDPIEGCGLDRNLFQGAFGRVGGAG